MKDTCDISHPTSTQSRIPKNITKSSSSNKCRQNHQKRNTTFRKIYSPNPAFIIQIKYYFKQMLLQQSLRKNGSDSGRCRYFKWFNEPLNLIGTAYNKMIATNDGEAFYSFFYSAFIKSSSYLLPFEVTW